MNEQRLDDGRLEVPARAETPDGSVIGDGMVVLDKADPLFPIWDEYLTGQGI